MVYAHGGNINKLAALSGRLPEEIVDFSANINPLGPPEGLRRLVSRNVEQLCHYPDPDAAKLVNAVADNLGVSPDRVVVGNGSTELIYALPRIARKKKAVVPVPSYDDYGAAARLAGLEIQSLVLKEEDGFLLDLHALAACLTGDEIVFLGQPNNPTGRSVDRTDLLALIDSRPDTLFVVDESFASFMPEYESLALHGGENLVVVQSLTKFFAIPGLRLGCACASQTMAALLRQHILPWSVNTLAQEVGVMALRDGQYTQRTRTEVSRLRHDLVQRLAGLSGLKVYPGEVNFLLVRIENQALEADELAQKLLMEGLAVRSCGNFAGLPDNGRYYFRIAVRGEEENELLHQALRRVLGGEPRPAKKQRSFSLMLQGTASNAGKSVLTAALCRILLQDGLRVAPFKSQNMSLNSFVTRDGLEMGRAQVVQAQACRLDPDVRMNPVLLKPSSDVGSQVIVMGRPVGNMSVNEYIKYKATAWQAVTTAYDELANEYDGVILEGAGSPGEVNLKHHDIVNMKMARYARSPVLLAGDIDRGGVFASFIGTMEVLTEWERSLVAGFIVNRFRGNAALLDDAFTYTLEHSGRPVVGVVPYLKDLGLPEEDSVSFKNGLFDKERPTGEHVVIALIDLPHISNFTDVEPFLAEPDVFLRIIRRAAELEAVTAEVAAVILPGSKNVVADMEYLEQSGLGRAIFQLAQGGRVEVVGICGGFQILGGRINDPFCLESDGKGTTGLGLLGMTTTLDQEKTLARRSTSHLQSDNPVYGYEIHHGRTETREEAIFADEKEERISAVSADGLIWGSYLHGIFDADLFRRWFIDRLRERQGLSSIGRVVAAYDMEDSLDRLADVVRKGLDMDFVYRLLRL